MRSPLFTSLLLLTMMYPFALAGSGADPEITDASGDTTDELTGNAITAPNSDIVAVWFAESPLEYTVTIKVADLTAPAAGTVHMWRVGFDANGTRFFAEVQRSATSSFGRLFTDGATGPTTFDGTADVSFDTAADTIAIVLPRDFEVSDGVTFTRFIFVEGTTLANPRARAYQGSGADNTGVLLLRVDETGVGRSFTFRVEEPTYPVHSGRTKVAPITTKTVTVNGIPATTSGSLSGATLSFVAGNQPKAMTFNGAIVTLGQDNVVTLQGFTGWYTLTNGHIKFAGEATAYTIT